MTKKLQSRQLKVKPFKLRQVTVGGNGLRPEVAHLSMHDIIMLNYDERGG